MAFKAKLQLADGEYDALSCDYSFHRDVDLKGRPDTNVYGGVIRFLEESNDDTNIVAKLMDQFEPVSGSVTFYKGLDAATMKKLSWENGYIMKYNETFNVTSKEPMKIYFEISAEKIMIGSENVDHKWPK
jgi:hypothetical protein